MDEKTSIQSDFQKRFYTLNEISDLYGLKKNTLYSATAKKLISFYRPGKHIMFTLADVDAYILSTKK